MVATGVSLPSNIGILTGESNLVVVDIDGNEGFEALGKERVEDLKKESVPCVKTGRGFHYYFRSKKLIKTKPGLVNKVDIKGEGGYVVAPPSKYVSVVSYEWINKPDGGFPDAPPWVSNGITAPVPHQFSGVTKKDFMPGEGVPEGHIRVNGQDIPLSELRNTPLVISMPPENKDVPATEIEDEDAPATEIENNVIPEGYRNNTLFKLACMLKRKNLPQDTALSSLIDANTVKCNPPLPEQEVKKILDSAYKYKPEVTVLNCTDLGNAKRLVAQHGDKIRYCFAWRKWLAWDEKTWYIDNNGQILRLAKETVKSIYEEAAQISDDNHRRVVAKWAVSSVVSRK